MKVEYKTGPIRGGLDNGYISVRPFIESLPRDVIGGANESDRAASVLVIHFGPNSENTDIAKDKKILRNRTLSRQFMKEFGAEKDDTIVFEQIGTYEFQLHLEKSDGRRISAPIAAARSIAKTEAEKRSQANERDLEKRNEVSRGVQPEFGVRQSRYEDGVHTLYAAVFTGDGVRLLGREKDFDGDLILVKIGMSNDTRRRCMELNAGFPPAATGKWVMKWQSDFADGRSAFKAETALKKELDLVATSLGGEFFLGDQAILSKTFSRIAAH